jgi:hypothetical protein
MDRRPTALERAYQLARSGKVEKVETIRQILRQEGLDPDQVSGPQLRRELRLMIVEARTRDRPSAASSSPAP